MLRRVLGLSRVAVVAHRSMGVRALSSTSTPIDERIANLPGAVSSMPDAHLTSHVLVYRPARNAMSQGTEASKKWLLKFHHTKQWQNPLMGWTSTQDTATQLRLSFDTQEEAVSYCKQHGFEFEIEEPQEKKKRVKSYSENFAPKVYGLKIPKK